MDPKTVKKECGKGGCKEVKPIQLGGKKPEPEHICVGERCDKIKRSGEGEILHLGGEGERNSKSMFELPTA